jgi:hypothetical protein
MEQVDAESRNGSRSQKDLSTRSPPGNAAKVPLQSVTRLNSSDQHHHRRPASLRYLARL